MLTLSRTFLPTKREFERRMWLRRFVRSSASASASASSSNRRFSAVTAAKYDPADISPVSNKDSVSTRENLGSRLLTLVNTKFSADFVLRKWKFEGRLIVPFELNLAVRELRKLKRYQHALEICEWRTKQRDTKLHSGDYALHLDLVAKIYGIEKTEKFFKAIPAPMLDHSTHSALLHSYVQNNLQDKAEALMAEMLESGLVKNPLPYNHMLSLYMANGQLEKVPKLIDEMKKTTSPNVVTYNMWLTYCVRQNDVETAERVFSELKDSKRDPDWLTHSAMANLYTKNGLGKKAMEALIEVEKLASRRNRGTYSSLLSLRTNIGDKEGVRGVWNKMKVMFPKRSDEEYKCVMSSLLKLGELKEAEEIYSEWETESGSRDSRVSNILLAAYINGGKMGKAEEFFAQMTKSRIKRSYTTLELLTWGFTKQRDAEKALQYFEAAVKSVEKWQSEEKLVSELLSLVEEGGNVLGAEKMLEILRVAFYVTTGIYNSVLRTYAKAGKFPLLVEERMKEDRVRMDKETRELIKTARRTYNV